MMRDYPIHCLLHDWGVRARVPLKSKKRVLERASEIISENYRNIDLGDLFDSLCARERLGSTALGEGVAVPHARIAHCTHPLGVLLQLNEGVDFDAPDGKPVDLIFVLVAPIEKNQAGPDAFAFLSEVFKNQGWLEKLRAATSDDALCTVAMAPPPSSASAARPGIAA